MPTIPNILRVSGPDHEVTAWRVRQRGVPWHDRGPALDDDDTRRALDMIAAMALAPDDAAQLRGQLLTPPPPARAAFTLNAAVPVSDGDTPTTRWSCGGDAVLRGETRDRGDSTSMLTMVFDTEHRPPLRWLQVQALTGSLRPLVVSLRWLETGLGRIGTASVHEQNVLIRHTLRHETPHDYHRRAAALTDAMTHVTGP